MVDKRQLELKPQIVISVDDETQLRILTAKDVSEEYLTWMNDSEIVKFTEQRYEKHTIGDIEYFVREKFASDADFLFGIFTGEQHVGNIKLGPVDWWHKTGEVSYLIGNKNFWGRGLGTSVVRKVVKFAFEELKLEKLNAGYYEPNEASGRVLSKCGFQIEGVRKQQFLYNGERIDHVLVGILRHNKII